MTTDDLALQIRLRRHELDLTQAALADRAGVSRRWLSDLEAGKPTAEVGLILATITALELTIDVHPAPPSTRPFSLDDIIQEHRGDQR